MRATLPISTLMICLALLAGCATTETYPVSGEQCGPNDPVQGLDVADCVPPTSVPG